MADAIAVRAVHACESWEDHISVIADDEVNGGPGSYKSMSTQVRQSSSSRHYSDSVLVGDDSASQRAMGRSGSYTAVALNNNLAVQAPSVPDLELGADGRAPPVPAIVDNGFGFKGGTSQTYDISVINLTYKVMEKKGKQMVEKVLLNGVNARARHGEVLAVMGPSGSSKTTFLDAISGRIGRQNLQGSVLVNGKPVDTSFFKVSQYVQQDDALFAMLTVAETLMFSARFRLPGSMSYGDKLKRVEAVIQQLGLTQCANTYVGNAQVKGVSGGERRRVSIGVELIHDPAVVFLDEPTSGLDSTSALHLMKTLSGLAVGRKRLVILTIHQPSFRILELIEQTLLLARGNVVYHGTVPQMTNFFRSIGHNVTGNVNIVEFALDTIQRIQDDALNFVKVTAHQKESHEMQGFERTNSLSRDKTEQLQTPAYASSFLSQTLTLAQRTAKSILRTPELFWSRLALAVATAIACGTIFLNVDQAEKGAQQRQVFLLFTVALMMYTTNESLPTFLAERPVLVREILGGAYKPLAYTLAQVLVFMPFLSLIALLNVSLAYFMVGLVHNAGAFFIFVLTLVLALLLANSFLAVFGAISPNFLVANASFTAVFTMMLIFSGFFIPRSYIPIYWIWLHYLSIVKYPYEILIWNEFSLFPNKIWFGTVTTEDLLSNLSLGGVHIWSNMAVMVGMIIGYRTIFYLLLRFRTNNGGKRIYLKHPSWR